VVFTGRSAERVAAAEAAYQEKFPQVTIIGYTINSLNKEGAVDEAGVAALFEWL
jgi:hypothetical protein